MDSRAIETKKTTTDVDYTIVGSSIVGLHAALRLPWRFETAILMSIGEKECCKAQIT
jgi:aspartate oxidase